MRCDAQPVQFPTIDLMREWRSPPHRFEGGWAAADEGPAPARRAPRSAVLMESALRLIQGDAHQWSEQTRSCPAIRGSGYPTKLTEPRLGCSPPGRRQERPEQETPVRGSVLTTRADLNCFDFRCFPIVGLANRRVTDCS